MIDIDGVVIIWRHTIWKKEERPRVVSAYAYFYGVGKTWGLIMNVGYRK